MSEPCSNPTVDQISEDLGVFADLGTEPPSVEEVQNGHTIRFYRNGDPTELYVSNTSDVIQENYSSNRAKHANYKAFLASGRFGNLRDWNSKQTAYLRQELSAVGSLIEIGGSLNDGMNLTGLTNIDDFLVSSQEERTTRVLLIDGPAGIGKTQFILSLADRRVQAFSTKRRPPILHVQSRGRTLSYLYDLIAFSLQRMRLEVTYDQVPVLAKHGLITIAIDGFDELADPDGYNRAWAEVSDLVEKVRGSGTLILAGRETFIGRDRIIRDISAIRPEFDEISVLTLQPPSSGTAIKWLAEQGWQDDQIQSIEEYLEPRSLALRPFFLKTLSDPKIAKSVSATESMSILSILMEAMIDREIDKFGDTIDRELDDKERRAYLREFIGEVARDMAESSTTSISDATLSWLVEVAAPKELSDEVLRILKARSQVVAFFTNDDRSGYRRFFHEKFYEFFLATSIIDMIVEGETGKILSRNILGSSFLETFGDVISSGTNSQTIKSFLSHILKVLREHPPVDRTRKNAATLALASLSVIDAVDKFVVENVDVDEARFSGTAAKGQLQNVVINQFDSRGGNLAEIEFSNVTILTLIADKETLLPGSFPTPTRVRDISQSGKTISAPDEVAAWRIKHLETPPEPELGLIPSELREHDAIKLLHKACRLRQYWLRRGDDIYANRILDDSYWSTIERVLEDSGLLKIKLRQASGTDARFLHVRLGDAILAEDSSYPEVKKLYSDLAKELQAA